jgi:hypothetical protein
MRTKIIYTGEDKNSNHILKKDGVYYMDADEYNQTWLFYKNAEDAKGIGTCHSKDYINKWIVNIAEWRDKQINSILDGED